MSATFTSPKHYTTTTTISQPCLSPDPSSYHRRAYRGYLEAVSPQGSSKLRQILLALVLLILETYKKLERKRAKEIRHCSRQKLSFFFYLTKSQSSLNARDSESDTSSLPLFYCFLSLNLLSHSFCSDSGHDFSSQLSFSGWYRCRNSVSNLSGEIIELFFFQSAHTVTTSTRGSTYFTVCKSLGLAS